MYLIIIENFVPCVSHVKHYKYVSLTYFYLHHTQKKLKTYTSCLIESFLWFPSLVIVTVEVLYFDRPTFCTHFPFKSYSLEKEKLKTCFIYVMKF